MWIALGVAVVALLTAVLVAVVVRSDDTKAPVATTVTTTTAPRSTTAPPTTAGGSTGDYTGRFKVSNVPLPSGGANRAYTVMEPSTRASGRRPALVMLHGLGGSASATIGIAKWPRLVVGHDVTVAFGEGAPALIRSWNAGVCCPPANQAGIDDVRYVGALVDDLVKRPDVDPEKVYLAGYSNGGFMVYKSLCTLADRFAGALVMMATNMAGCAQNSPIDLRVVHGSADPVVPYNGGLATSSLLLQGGVFRPVPEGVGAFAAAQSCAPQPTVAKDGPRTVSTWSGCAEGTSVRLTLVEGLAHDPPGRPEFNSISVVIDLMGV